jgi:hypothetical protein
VRLLAATCHWLARWGIAALCLGLSIDGPNDGVGVACAVLIILGRHLDVIRQLNEAREHKDRQ